MGKTSFYRLLRVFTNYSSVTYSVSNSCTFVLDNVNADGSAFFIHKVIVNVHFKPDLATRDLRERLHCISLHWPRYPEALGVIIGDFNICEPEEGEIQRQEPNLHRR